MSPLVYRLCGGVLAVLFLAGCASSGPVLVPPEISETSIQTARDQLARHPLPASRDTSVHDMEPEMHRVFRRIRPAIVEACLEAFGGHSDCQPFVRQMRLELVYDETVNAYADAGDYSIGIHMGLMSSVGSDDELAWVMAHEAAHLLLGHGWKKEESSIGYGLMGAALGGVLGAAVYEPGMDPGYVGDIATAGMEVGSYMGYVAYSPEMELEADQFAVHVLRHAGLRPDASLDMIVRLDRGDVPEEVRRGDGWAGFLDTHPANDRRLASMAALVDDIDQPGQLLQQGQYLPLGSDPNQAQCAARVRQQWPNCKTYRGGSDSLAFTWRCGGAEVPKLYRLCGAWIHQCIQDPASCRVAGGS